MSAVRSIREDAKMPRLSHMVVTDVKSSWLYARTHHPSELSHYTAATATVHIVENRVC